ncbi:hypothetical protein SDC9_42735 [bioreactor metagenome]|uniref:Uncharacterized protein n=1 Tax=bioreactor metagenome TaxID=1076179 RepID=A0A644W230_9ZZZZ
MSAPGFPYTAWLLNVYINVSSTPTSIPKTITAGISSANRRSDTRCCYAHPLEFTLAVPLSPQQVIQYLRHFGAGGGGGWVERSAAAGDSSCLYQCRHGLARPGGDIASIREVGEVLVARSTTSNR